MRAPGQVVDPIFFFFFSWALHGPPGVHCQGRSLCCLGFPSPYQVLCDSNILTPWQDGSSPHPGPRLPLSTGKKNPGPQQPLPGRREREGSTQTHFSTALGGLGFRAPQKSLTWSCEASVVLSAMPSLPVGLAGPAALSSAGRAAWPRTQCSSNTVQHSVGSASQAQPCHAQVFPYPRVMTSAVSPPLWQPM